MLRYLYFMRLFTYLLRSQFVFNVLLTVYICLRNIYFMLVRELIFIYICFSMHKCLNGWHMCTYISSFSHIHLHISTTEGVIQQMSYICVPSTHHQALQTFWKCIAMACLKFGLMRIVELLLLLSFQLLVAS